MIIEACQRIMDHTFSLWQKETIQEEHCNWRKSSKYSDTVMNQGLQWGVKFPFVTQQVPLHSVKVVVWCAVSSW